jgi:hypothetical protein
VLALTSAHPCPGRADVGAVSRQRAAFGPVPVSAVAWFAAGAWRFGARWVLFLAGLAPACATVSVCRVRCSLLAGVLPVPVCCRAERGAGGRRPTILAFDLDLDLDFRVWAFVVPACAVTGGAVPDLASPGPHDGGVRSGTVEPASRRVIVLAGAANARGLGCTVAARRVALLCGRCAGSVRFSASS